jgi:hypothetical protein
MNHCLYENNSKHDGAKTEEVMYDKFNVDSTE